MAPEFVGRILLIHTLTISYCLVEAGNDWTDSSALPNASMYTSNP